MSSAESGRPAGTPSTMMTSAWPCDSPAVRKRSIAASFYRSFCNAPAADTVAANDSGGRSSCTIANAVGDHMRPVIVEERYWYHARDAWIDLATGRVGEGSPPDDRPDR